MIVVCYYHLTKIENVNLWIQAQYSESYASSDSVMSNHFEEFLPLNDRNSFPKMFIDGDIEFEI